MRKVDCPRKSAPSPPGSNTAIGNFYIKGEVIENDLPIRELGQDLFVILDPSDNPMIIIKRDGSMKLKGHIYEKCIQ